ncbi:uncharacterized protein LOC111032874 [Myzus persicae]|uniref:uncharacterized protein LOC111032874 n=1 Tax=Myzus persicae TaxID=13164 RepID=UPI000B939A98|nr:uncharacterized protein LOC111032874 [Myzus persicae]
MSQLDIFGKCVDENVNVFQDLLEISQLEITGTGKDIFMKIKECVDRKGKTIGCVALLKPFLGRKLFSNNCIMHREALCAKDMKLNDVIDPAVRCINYIRAKALHRRQFRILFEDEINEFEVLKFLEEKQEMTNERDLLKNES